MVSIAHSPDGDDYCLFWALRNGLIDSGDISFAFSELGTQDLNNQAIAGNFDVIAISSATYPLVAKNYMIIPVGASVGRNYGPVIVAKKPLQLSDIGHSRIGIPGETTTAATLVSKAIPSAVRITYPIKPLSLIFDALDSGEIEAAALIHEGQMFYRERNLHLVLDLGKWWHKQTQLPLVLGINVIKKSLGISEAAHICRLIEKSIHYSVMHREEVIEAICAYTKDDKPDFCSPSQVAAYLERYANVDSLFLSQECREGLRILIEPAMSRLAQGIEYAPITTQIF